MMSSLSIRDMQMLNVLIVTRTAGIRMQDLIATPAISRIILQQEPRIITCLKYLLTVWIVIPKIPDGCQSLSVTTVFRLIWDMLQLLVLIAIKVEIIQTHLPIVTPAINRIILQQKHLIIIYQNFQLPVLIAIR